HLQMTDTDINIESIAKVQRSKLFPCSLKVDELDIDSKYTRGKKKNPPRWMNSYIVFRRALGLLLKGIKMDGKQLTLLARQMWNESNKYEKEEYKNISLELRKRHRKRYPEFKYGAKR
ncbi:10835_t:CDS:1, partial [Acaulospora morrowiae]